VVDVLPAGLLERNAAAIIPRRGGMPALVGALRTGFALELPLPGRWEASGGLTLVRTAPHQVLALRDGAGTRMFDQLDAALGTHAGVVDLSEARAAVRIGGPGARDVLSRLVPLDLHPRVMQAGNAASTMAGHMGVLLLQLDDAPSYELLCQRSLAGTLLRALELAQHAA